MMQKQQLTEAIPKTNSGKLLFASVFLFALLFCILVLWAQKAQIKGAVVTSGVVNVPDNIKEIQHLHGGVVRSIDVSNGDAILKGQVLFEIDVTETRETRSSAISRIHSLQAEIARLLAERDLQKDIDWAASYLSEIEFGFDPEQESSQLDLFNGRRAMLKNESEKIALRIADKMESQRLFEVQVEMQARRSDIALDQLSSKQQLFVASSGTKVSVQNAALNVIDLEEGQAKFNAGLQATKTSIVVLKAELNELSIAFHNSVLRELEDARIELLLQSQTARSAKAKIDRSIVRSPSDGEIQDLTAFVEGAVILPGEVVANIVPTDGDVYIECALDPSRVDEIYEGQTAFVTFYTMGNVRGETFAATVSRISPSASSNAKGNRYFGVDIQLDDAENRNFGNGRLLPGMTADVQIATSSKSVLTYILDPLLRQFENALN